MAIQLSHKSLAEAHHFAVALASDAEVRTALATAHRQCGQRVLKGLFEAQELQNREVYRSMETQSALVGTDSRVELYAIAEVHLNLTLVVDPGHTERDDALRLYDALHNLRLLKLRMLVVDVLDGFEHFSNSL